MRSETVRLGGLGFSEIQSRFMKSISILRGLMRITLLVRALIGIGMGVPIAVPPEMELAMLLKDPGMGMEYMYASILSMRGDFMMSRMTSMKLSSDASRRPLEGRVVVATTGFAASTSSPSRSNCDV